MRAESRTVTHAEVQAYFDSVSSAPAWWECEIGEWRNEVRKLYIANAGPMEPVASIEELDAGGVPARLYRAFPDTDAVLVWFHGGGWMVGDADCYDAVARRLTRRAGCAVLSVNYRLAPEHRFPAAVDDACVATQWAAEHFAHVAVGGESAGGNLAAVVARRSRDGRQKLALQLLVMPATDSDVDSSFYELFRERYSSFGGLTDFGEGWQIGVRWLWEQYAPQPSDRASPDASPLRAQALGGMAAALVITAEHDILRGEAEEYARALRDAGVPVNLVSYAEQVHGFFGMPGAFTDAEDAITLSAQALRDAFRVARMGANPG